MEVTSTSNCLCLCQSYALDRCFNANVLRQQGDLYSCLHFTPIRHNISQNTSIPSANGAGLTGAVSSHLQVYCTHCGLFLLSHVVTDEILDRETTIKQDNYSINGSCSRSENYVQSDIYVCPISSELFWALNNSFY